jgi:hypothetical protein
MSLLAEFTSCDSDDKDITISFVIKDDQRLVKSLILSRTFFNEKYLDEEFKGVIVSYEGDKFEITNTLESVEFKDERVFVNAKFSKYVIDTSKLENAEIVKVKKLLKKQNYDNRFEIKNA